jgi:hypothetical protein
MVEAGAWSRPAIRTVAALREAAPVARKRESLACSTQRDGDEKGHNPASTPFGLAAMSDCC